MPHIVLVEPEIPQNTGNIARLCAATKTTLQLVEPLGFELSDKYLKRAGLDYWPEVDLVVHPTWNAFLENTPNNAGTLWFFSTKATTPYTEVQFTPNDYLVFGSETKGLAAFFHETYAQLRLQIPISNPNVRSLNLANSAAIALYELRRQCGVY